MKRVGVVSITIDQYCIKYDKEAKKVVEWIGRGFIPGCDWNSDAWIIPDNARLPYTEHRNPQGYAVYKSFVKAYYLGKNVTPTLYSMTQERFDSINRQLVEWGLITEEYLDNLIYYNATPKGEEFVSFTSSKLNKFIQQTFFAVSNGVVNGMIPQ